MKKYSFFNPLSLCFLFSLILMACNPDKETGELLQDEPEAQSLNPATIGPSIKVMTFNVRQEFYEDQWNSDPQWEERQDIILQTIVDQDADFVLLQEDIVEVPDFADVGGGGYTNGDTVIIVDPPVDADPVRPLDFLRANLPVYAFLGAGSRDGIPGGLGEHCSILYKRDRFTLIDSAHIALSDTYWIPGSMTWGNETPRKATWGKFNDLLAEPGGNLEQFIVINTHFEAGGGIANFVRVKSAELLVDLIDDLNGSDPVIVGGDLNSNEDKLPHDILLNGGLTDGYRDLFPIRLPEEATFHGFTGDLFGSRIDLIYHSAALQTVFADILTDSFNGEYPSDHFALIHEIE